jgi:hypothetical protein
VVTDWSAIRSSRPVSSASRPGSRASRLSPSGRHQPGELLRPDGRRLFAKPAALGEDGPRAGDGLLKLLLIASRR